MIVERYDTTYMVERPNAIIYLLGTGSTKVFKRVGDMVVIEVCGKQSTSLRNNIDQEAYNKKKRSTLKC
jgi:hypothetical protein